jgi:hypothetical protein
VASPAMPPPPGMAPNAGPPASAPMVASPAPQQEGTAKQAAFQTLQIVQNARQLAQQYPEVAPLIRQVNDLMQQVQMKIAQSTSAGEPQAPPVG